MGVISYDTLLFYMKN